jgi:hypothetical protein
MGYIEILNGSGFTLRMENDKESLNPSMQIDVCRVMTTGYYMTDSILVCSQCHCRQ